MMQSQRYLLITLINNHRNKKSNVLREEGRAKRQLCEDALIHQELAENFEFECNTKETPNRDNVQKFQ